MWLLLSFLAALFQGLTDLFAKNLTKTINAYSLAFSYSIITVLCLFPYIIFTKGPEIGASFWSSLLITGLINSVTVVLVFKALKRTELSLITPIYNLSPLFLLFTAPLLVGEFPKPIGLVGVFLILFGTYVLNFKGKVNFEPFLEIYKDRGQRLILLVCFLWAISSNFYKIGMQNSSPIYFIFALNLFITICLIPFMINKKRVVSIQSNWPQLLLLGLLGTIVAVFEWTAVNTGLVVYVLSIKRLSVLVSILGAYILFREKHPVQRLVAALIMIFGVILIVFA